MKKNLFQKTQYWKYFLNTPRIITIVPHYVIVEPPQTLYGATSVWGLDLLHEIMVHVSCNTIHRETNTFYAMRVALIWNGNLKRYS